MNYTSLVIEHSIDPLSAPIICQPDHLRSPRVQIPQNPEPADPRWHDHALLSARGLREPEENYPLFLLVFLEITTY